MGALNRMYRELRQADTPGRADPPLLDPRFSYLLSCVGEASAWLTASAFCMRVPFHQFRRATWVVTQASYTFDIADARRILRYSPVVGFEEAKRRTVAFFQAEKKQQQQQQSVEAAKSK